MIEILQILKFIFREERLEVEFGMCDEAEYGFDEEIVYFDSVDGHL